MPGPRLSTAIHIIHDYFVRIPFLRQQNGVAFTNVEVRLLQC